MKKYLFLALMVAFSSLAFTACGDDDDDKVSPEDIENLDFKYTTDFKESGNQMILTVKGTAAGVTMTQVWTATFNGDVLASFIISETYPNETLAKAAYQEYMEDKEKVSISGKTITRDWTEEYAELDRATMRIMLQSIAEEIKNQHLK
jgi:hypothetical protein